MVLDGGVRQPETVGGRLLRPGDEHGCNHADLTVGGTSGRVARRPSRHALRNQSNGSGGSASRIVIGRSVVAGLCLSPRPTPCHQGGLSVSSPETTSPKPRRMACWVHVSRNCFQPRALDSSNRLVAMSAGPRGWLRPTASHHGDPACLEPLGRVRERRCARRVEGRDARHAEHDHPDLAQLGEPEEERVGDAEEQRPVEAAGDDVLVKTAPAPPRCGRHGRARSRPSALSVPSAGGRRRSRR